MSSLAFSPEPADSGPAAEPSEQTWDAYQQTLTEMRALPEAEVLQVNLNVGLCVSTTLGCLEKVRAMQGRIATLPCTDLKAVNSLERYALALAQAQALVGASGRSELSVSDLYRQARLKRDVFRLDLRSLAQHGVLSQPAPRPKPGSRGYHGVAFELMSLVAFLRHEWPNVAGKTLVTEQHLREAETLCHLLLTSVGEEAQKAAREQRAEQLMLRDRAFTLLMKAYEETRRAVAYLLWDEDQGSAVLPSLYAVRFSKRRKKTR